MGHLLRVFKKKKKKSEGEAGEGGLANGAPARSELSSAFTTEFDLRHFN